MISKNIEYNRGSLSIPLLAKLPAIGMSLFILGGLLFGAFAFSLETNGLFVQGDHPFGLWLITIADHQPRMLDILLRDVSFYLGREVIVGLTILLAAIFLGRRAWRELALLVLGVGGGGLLWRILSIVFNRPRPIYPNPIEMLTDPSFPSGHSISAVLFYGLMAYLINPKVTFPPFKDHGNTIGSLAATGDWVWTPVCRGSLSL